VRLEGRDNFLTEVVLPIVEAEDFRVTIGVARRKYAYYHYEADEQRDEFWRQRDELPGRVIEVKYKEESSDKKTGQLSLQFPIFVSLREEGKEESLY